MWQLHRQWISFSFAANTKSHDNFSIIQQHSIAPSHSHTTKTRLNFKLCNCSKVIHHYIYTECIHHSYWTRDIKSHLSAKNFYQNGRETRKRSFLSVRWPSTRTHKDYFRNWKAQQIASSGPPSICFNYRKCDIPTRWTFVVAGHVQKINFLPHSMSIYQSLRVGVE